MQGRGLTLPRTSPPSPSSTFFFPRSLAGPLSPPQTQPQTPTLFCFSISASSPIKYVLYFGYDAGDRVFDNAKARESMDKMISGVVGDLPVEWRWFKCAVCFHSFCFNMMQNNTQRTPHHRLADTAEWRAKFSGFMKTCSARRKSPALRSAS
jgi:hypothetical protein